MSDSNRGFVLFATITALWVGTVIGGAESRCQIQQNAYSIDQAKAYSQNNATQFASQRAWLPCLVERSVANPKAGESSNREERDLMAQETTALWAFWMLVISGIMAMITALGTILLYKQIVLTREAVKDTGKATIAMQEANEITRDGMEKQLRAYVHPESFNYISQPDKTNQTFGWCFSINWKNSGVTPALSASMLIWPEVVDGTLAEDFQFDKIADDHVPIVFGPNMPVGSMYVCVSADDIKKFVAGQKALYLWGWVKYRDVFPASPERQTRFCYRLSASGDPTKAVGPDNIVHWSTTIHFTHNSAN